MSREPVVLAGLELGEQFLDVLLNLGEFRNERVAVHHREISRYAPRCKSQRGCKSGAM
jgi:hypothetical protein